MKTKKKSSNITVDINEEIIYEEYGFDDKLLLSDVLADTIEYVASTRPIKQKLKLNIKENVQANIDEKQFTDAYKNTFSTKIDGKKHEIGRCIITGIVLWIVSIGLILFEQFVIAGSNAILCEIFEIISWVFTWVAVETLTIELIQLIMDKRKYSRLLDVKFKFIKYVQK